MSLPVIDFHETPINRLSNCRHQGSYYAFAHPEEDGVTKNVTIKAAVSSTKV